MEICIFSRSQRENYFSIVDSTWSFTMSFPLCFMHIPSERVHWNLFIWCCFPCRHFRSNLWRIQDNIKRKSRKSRRNNFLHRNDFLTFHLQRKRRSFILCHSSQTKWLMFTRWSFGSINVLLGNYCLSS